MTQPTPVTPIDAGPDAVTDRIGGAKVRIDPELRNRRFTLRPKQPIAIDTLVRLEARLSTGSNVYCEIS